MIFYAWNYLPPRTKPQPLRGLCWLVIITIDAVLWVGICSIVAKVAAELVRVTL